MKGIAAFGFFLLFLAAIALISLRNTSDDRAATLQVPNEADFVGMQWQLAAMRNAPGAVQADIELTFASDGTLQGAGNCHSFTGTYTFDAGQLIMGGLETSESRCPADQPGFEPQLVLLLSSATAVRIGARGLVFLDAGNTRLMRFVGARKQ